MPEQLYVGLMSGTSIDAIDCALVRCGDTGVSLVQTLEHPIPKDTRSRIEQLSSPGDNEIEQMGVLDRELGIIFGQGVLALLQASGHSAKDITAIGSHGQTIRHRPPCAGSDHRHSFTLQIGDPNTIAELTGITTAADFRRRDIAAGGEGAPLAPAFHAAAFAKHDTVRAIVNIGGIANVSLLNGSELLSGFDSGPGNTLLDHWIQRHKGETFDRDGRWSAEGTINSALAAALRAHPYLRKSGPRSTGKEAFNLEWLDQLLADIPAITPQDVQATLADFTANCIASSIAKSGFSPTEIYICGGGAHNTDIMRRLYQEVSPASVATTEELGLHPDWVEAAAFAWLAYRCINNLTGNNTKVTGASGERVLGGIYPP